MRKLNSLKLRVYVIAGGVLAASLVGAGTASATPDPTLTDAVGQGTSYFSDNIGIIIGAFVAVAGLLWLLAMGFRSMGIRRKGAI